MTECIIKNYSAAGGGGTNIFIVHEGQRYYSRVNHKVQDTPGMRNYHIAQFHQRRKLYATQ